MLRDSEAWRRAGPGLELQFFATDVELQDLLDALPAKYQPYRVWLDRATPVPGSRTVAWHVESHALAGSVDWARRLRDPLLWVSSERLTPSLSEAHGSLARALSGCLFVELGSISLGRRDSSRISMINRVEHVLTHAREDNTEYAAIFAALRKDLRARLTWSSIRRLSNGKLDEDVKWKLMTDAAADAARQDPDGWAVQPGRRVAGQA